MMGIIIWIILIIVIMNYSKIKSKGKNNYTKGMQQKAGNSVYANPKNTGTVKGGQDTTGNTIQRQPNRNLYETVQNAGNVNIPNPARQSLNSSEQAKQAELKRRLLQRYGNTADRKKESNAPKTGSLSQEEQRTQGQQDKNIFDRAYRNAQEDFFQNTYQEQMLQKAEESYGMGTESELMRKVQDLMVMGYQGDMRYERDFIGEAEDLLNRFL